MRQILLIFLILSSYNSKNQKNTSPTIVNAEVERIDSVKIQIKLVSGRNFFDQNKVDTIIIKTPLLNQFNRGIEVSGALLNKLSRDTYSTYTEEYDPKMDSFEIKVSTYYPGLNRVNFRINKMGKHGERLDLYDTFSILAR